MQIFVKLYRGKTITLVVEPSDLISEIKLIVASQSTLPIALQRLVSSGKNLDERRSLSDYDIKSEQTLFEYYNSVMCNK
jgi:hypothetical protein